jgi:hypothetical protein
MEESEVFCWLQRLGWRWIFELGERLFPIQNMASIVALMISRERETTEKMGRYRGKLVI